MKTLLPMAPDLPTADPRTLTDQERRAVSLLTSDSLLRVTADGPCIIESPYGDCVVSDEAFARFGNAGWLVLRCLIRGEELFGITAAGREALR